MTREEEIKKAVQEFIEERKTAIGRAKRGGWYFANIFEEGIKWADEHPKSPWISVKEDLPCNHKELLLSTECHTVSVFTYKKGGACGIDSMIIRKGKWEWEAWKETYLYWMPIPNLPKIGD